MLQILPTPCLIKNVTAENQPAKLARLVHIVVTTQSRAWYALSTTCYCFDTRLASLPNAPSILRRTLLAVLLSESIDADESELFALLDRGFVSSTQLAAPPRPMWYMGATNSRFFTISSSNWNMASSGSVGVNTLPAPPRPLTTARFDGRMRLMRAAGPEAVGPAVTSVCL